MAPIFRRRSNQALNPGSRVRNEPIESVPNPSNLVFEFAFVDSILPDGLPIGNNLNGTLCHGSKNAGRPLEHVQTVLGSVCMSLSYAHAAGGVRRRARCRSRALGEPARPMRRNAARLKYRHRCVATRMNERARAHPAERGECRGRSMTRRARQGDRPRAERMRAASRASAAGLPRASPRRHLTRRRAMGADFHPSAARRGDIRVPGARRRRAAARARAPAHSAACRVLVRYAPPSSRAALAGASHRPITPSAS
ncbi:hypothetical protein Y023_5519 [Burkholderia pseudomallei A79D]|nr:hypothetical protein X997_1395 [Burkholderia pseudomallei A79C]KGX95281.1 hypothetical protein Y023_5519 [Burkholderia pseudomallei A79D]